MKESSTVECTVSHLSSPCLYHELPRKVRSWLRLEWSNDNGLIQRISGNNLQSYTKVNIYQIIVKISYTWPGQDSRTRQTIASSPGSLISSEKSWRAGPGDEARQLYRQPLASQCSCDYFIPANDETQRGKTLAPGCGCEGRSQTQTSRWQG